MHSVEPVAPTPAVDAGDRLLAVSRKVMVRWRACADGVAPMEVDGLPNGTADHSPAEPSAAHMKLVTGAMELLRELGSLHLSLRLMAATDVVASLTACARHLVRQRKQNMFKSGKLLWNTASATSRAMHRPVTSAQGELRSSVKGWG